MSKVYDVVAWHHDDEPLVLCRTEVIAQREYRRLVDEGYIVHPLGSIVEREVIEE